MDETFTLAHLSDVHLGPLPGFWPRHWNTKRLLGFLNWQRRRRFVHRTEAALQLVDDLRAFAPDHVAVTGDLTNIGMPSEHSLALAWLERLGGPADVSVVPGNHDVYTHLRRDPGVLRWRAHMSGEVGDSESDVLDELFPYVRRLGRAAVVGLNSAVPTPPGQATGYVSAAQLGKLPKVLDALAGEGLFRVVLVHHPPLAGQASPRRALTNARELETVLCRHGAELVLHGHNHRTMIAWRDGPQGAFPIIGVPSASVARAHGRDQLARYNLYAISHAGGGWEIEMRVRGLAAEDGDVVELAREMLRPGPDVV